MNELMAIERLTGTAVLEASALCNPNVDRRAAEKIEGEWRGRWLLALHLCGHGHPVTLICYRGQTLITAAINNLFGLPTPMPADLMIYPQEAA
ncbi:hypothetical protein [Marinobacter sp. Hex_13]|uniref:hypothetical protein n=1 Tax=Marinobacter sp. Hex_13 TaxID=1795866 RepID=UPI000799D683|nr:hypothetical protein [Marinobacter sp. Hex_13]KXJ45858.1 MAG: hypothetical protein AXW11_12265 [Marinobacter sp. Hex_13]